MSKETEIHGRYQFPNGLSVAALIAQLQTLPEDAVVKAVDSNGVELKLIGPPESDLKAYANQTFRMNAPAPEFYIVVGGTV